MPYDCFGGLLMGVVIARGVRAPAGRGKVLVFALCVWALGVGLGWVLARVAHAVLGHWRDVWELMWSLLLQASDSVVGMALAWSWDPVGKPKMRESELA